MTGMRSPPDPPRLPAAVRLRLALSGLALLWERLWPRLWPAVFVLLGFVALALFDVLPGLPGTVHALVLVLFVGTFAYGVLQALPGLRPVGRAAARHRLDRSAPTADRPLTALADRLAEDGAAPLTQALWQTHQERMRRASRRLTVRWPVTDMARREPWGVRAAVILLLVIGAAAAGGDWASRLERAVSPALADGRSAVAVEVWITPPAYTGRAPIFLRGSPATADTATMPAVAIPAGSAALARVTGTGTAPSLAVGQVETRFTALPGDPGAAKAYRAETTITGGNRLEILAGRRALAGWPVNVIADRGPTIAFAAPPESEGGSGLLGLGFVADDDHGVTGVDAAIRLAPAVRTGPDAADAAHAADAAGAGNDRSTLMLPLDLAEAGAPAVQGRSLVDLAAHPWAGRPVEIVLIATDAIGQQGRSEALTVTLPERAFIHPVARAIAAERSQLGAPPPSSPEAVAARLAAIGAEPEAFDGDVVVALGLAVGSQRLLNEGSAGAASVAPLLWDLAVRLEDGGLTSAERRLLSARQQLQEALRNGAGAGEIERLADALKEALDQFLAAVALELARRQETDLAPFANGPEISGDILRDLVDRARELSRAGANDGARALLSELQRLLDGLRMGLRQSVDPQQLRAAQESLRQMRSLQERQQQLLDRTFEQMRDQQERRTSRRGSERDAGIEAQRALRQDLGRLAERLQEQLGQMPPALAGADQAMREALQGLTGDRLGDAVAAQGQAVDALARAFAASRDALAQQMGAGGVAGFGTGAGDGDGDPFGRPAANAGRGFALGSVPIPERDEIQRIQELLQELRRRAGERDRPGPELEYLRRLLQQF